MTIDPRGTEALFSTFENALGSGKNYRQALGAFTKALTDLVIPCEPRPKVSQMTSQEDINEWSLSQSYHNEILQIAALLSPPYKE
jgi:hypothetical protein